MAQQSLFTPPQNAVDALVAAHPLALLVTQTANGVYTSPLPLLLDRQDPRGPVLLGHFARSNPHLELLKESTRALALFQGPQAYISPSWYADRTQAPTWNYMLAEFTIDIELSTDPADTRKLVELLVDEMERDRPKAWTTAEMGARYDLLAKRIVGFRGWIRNERAKFKLGQDERPGELREMLAALRAAGDEEIATMIESANATRL